MEIGAGMCLVPSHLPNNRSFLLQGGIGSCLLPYHRFPRPSVFVPLVSTFSRPLTPVLGQTLLYFSLGAQIPGMCQFTDMGISDAKLRVVQVIQRT